MWEKKMGGVETEGKILQKDFPGVLPVGPYLGQVVMGIWEAVPKV
jgi:hypothetical protein